MSGEANKTYKDTFKNTIAFGGFQVFSILISVIRGKLIAVLLGPVGIGINNLFMSSLTMLTTFTGFGLDLSAVRAISESNENSSKIVKITKRLFLYTGILGLLLTLFLSYFLSKWTFATTSYTMSFALLSIYMLFTAINRGQQTIMRGLRKVKVLIYSGLISSLIGLFISIPLYYFLGKDGIVPAIILTSIAVVIVTSFYTKTFTNSNVKVSIEEIRSSGREMVKLGMMMVVASLLGLITKYLINISIGRIGDIADVGLYAAAIGISSQYIGFILNSLSADFFPRLVKVHGDSNEISKVVNEQTEIIVLLATPLLIILLITAPLLISLLLSKEFLPIVDFIRFIAIGSFFQMISFCMGYISFAKNDKKTYLILEGVLSNVFQLIITVGCYYFYGLKGLGYAFCTIYVLYSFIIYFFVRNKYGYKRNKETSELIAFSLLFLLAAFFAVLYIESALYKYLLTSIIFSLCFTYNYSVLNKRFDIITLIKHKFRKR